MEDRASWLARPPGVAFNCSRFLLLKWKCTPRRTSFTSPNHFPKRLKTSILAMTENASDVAGRQTDTLSALCAPEKCGQRNQRLVTRGRNKKDMFHFERRKNGQIMMMVVVVEESACLAAVTACSDCLNLIEAAMHMRG